MVPVLSSQLDKGDAQGDCKRPGEEGAATFKAVKVIQDSHQGHLRHVFNESIISAGTPGKCCVQAFDQNNTQLRQRCIAFDTNLSTAT